MLPEGRSTSCGTSKLCLQPVQRTGFTKQPEQHNGHTAAHSHVHLTDDILLTVHVARCVMQTFSQQVSAASPESSLQ